MKVAFLPELALDDLTALPNVPSAEYMEHYGLLPLRLVDGRLQVATWRESVDVQALDDLRMVFAVEVELLTGPEYEIRTAIKRIYGGEATAEDLIAKLPDGGLEVVAQDAALDDLVSLANEAPVVKLVNLLLLDALEAGASDVHLEEYPERLRARYRIDGVLQDAPTPPAALRQAVISRVKIMADLDISERRLPQDGRIRLRLQDRQIDVRVATLPTLHGESVVLRLLDKERGRIALEDLGMAEDTLVGFKATIERPNGIVLATGPTGSGKTTTLYAAVDHIRTGREKIITVEDPVEYELTGVPQVAVSEKLGLGFAVALRALLRQDPDILLVGEIRDEETARVATHAALTGHLVLSTLHTNDAPSALTRLQDLGVPPYLITSTVEAILAQRLVRKVCQSCAEHVAPEPALVAALGARTTVLETVPRRRGCDECRGTGYRGRTGIYEILILDEEIQHAVIERRSGADLRRISIAKGMRSLGEDGIRLVQAGLTTPEEVLRVTRS